MIKTTLSLAGLALALALPSALADGPGTPYCYGVGCPEANDDPTAGCVNSSGVGALLTGSGSASVAADDLVLTCTQLPPYKFALIFRGAHAMSMPVPFGSGLLCSNAPFFRGHVYNAGATGTVVDGPGLVAEAAQLDWEPIQIDPGDVWNFQCWFRDDAGPLGIPWNTSNAYSVTFTP